MTKTIMPAMDEGVPDEARVYAAKRDTTVDGPVRNVLTPIVRQDDRTARARQGRVEPMLDGIETSEECPCVPADAAPVRHGAEIAQRYRISYWDGAIIAAAEGLRAHTLYTEDLGHGQLQGSVRVVNPFLQV